MPQFQAIFFDMDGLLIDSEPLWREAQVEIFGHLGLHLQLEDCAATTGLRIDEVCFHWYAIAPWAGPSPVEVAHQIVDAMIAAVLDRGQPMPGALLAVEAARRQGQPMALVTSSPLCLAKPTLQKLGLEGAFDLVASAESKAYGKPHPGIYLDLVEQLHARPARCLAFEDSLNGVLAAKSGRLYCAAVPSAHDRTDPRFAIADERLDSLCVVDDAWLRQAEARLR